MVKEGDFVAIFHSIHRVMKAEKQLKAAKTDILLIPVPRELSSDCGLAIRIKGEQREQVLALLDEAGLAPAELHRRGTGGFTEVG